MILSERLRTIREQKNMTQGDIEQRTGLKRSYVSRLEHGRTIPSLATLERFAQALEVPLY
ncbi:MAG TPA: helix-turn-helix transcriptional regulator [Candidatus Dormibacteraeota bacterium]|nr:helix-turn-helix transcriptional regulator [Candidatus Dormibacteraeota bacterium]